MNTQEITIGALTLISVGFGILFALKYRELKSYYKAEQKENTNLRDSNIEQQERINVLSKQNTTANNLIKDLLAENKRKTAKLLAKNQEIQELKNIGK